MSPRQAEMLSQAGAGGGPAGVQKPSKSMEFRPSRRRLSCVEWLDSEHFTYQNGAAFGFAVEGPERKAAPF